MLELFGIIAFVKLLSRTAISKNRSKGWAALGVLFWFGGEVMGMTIGLLLGMEQLAAYGIALLMAGAGALVAYLVVKALRPLMDMDLDPAA